MNAHLFSIRRSPRRASIRAARFSLTKISHRSHRGARAHLVVRNQCPFIETRSISRADENYFRSLCESLSARASKRKNLGSLPWLASSRRSSSTRRKFEEIKVKKI